MFLSFHPVPVAPTLAESAFREEWGAGGRRGVGTSAVGPGNADAIQMVLDAVEMKVLPLKSGLI